MLGPTNNSFEIDLFNVTQDKSSLFSNIVAY